MSKWHKWLQKRYKGDINALNKAWEEVLPKEIEADSYRERLYRALVTHEQFRQFRDIFSAISPTFPEIAEKMGIKPEELNQIIQLGGVAGTASRRLPLIDVRYHQVMRDVYQVGVYFENGDITYLSVMIPRTYSGGVASNDGFRNVRLGSPAMSSRTDPL